MKMKCGTQCDFCSQYCDHVIFRLTKDGYQEVICDKCIEKERALGLPDDTTIFE